MVDKQEMQFAQCRDRHPWRPKFHRSASHRVKHPRGHDHNYAGRDFNVDELPGGPPFAVLALQAAPVQGMPAVEDLNFLAAMGRMNGRWHLGGRTGCSLAVFEQANAPRQ